VYAGGTSQSVLTYDVILIRGIPRAKMLLAYIYRGRDYTRLVRRECISGVSGIEILSHAERCTMPNDATSACSSRSSLEGTVASTDSADRCRGNDVSI